MTYHAPELLLVGAAQNFVLGAAKGIVGPRVNHDFPQTEFYTTFPGIRFDSAIW